MFVLVNPAVLPHQRLLQLNLCPRAEIIMELQNMWQGSQCLISFIHWIKETLYVKECSLLVALWWRYTMESCDYSYLGNPVVGISWTATVELSDIQCPHVQITVQVNTSGCYKKTQVHFYKLLSDSFIYSCTCWFVMCMVFPWYEPWLDIIHSYWFIYSKCISVCLQLVKLNIGSYTPNV